MANLVDDLLSFSRAGKEELILSELDIENIVKNVFEEIRAQYPNRVIEFKVASLPKVFADISMLKVVLTNLISNALKFTGTKEKSIIEFNSYNADDNLVYYIKDNGVGFDMKYADKIFGVFQRLHKQDEFEGTGVGLALVQRIISKHGGQVWVESKINEGSIFYFSLPLKDKISKSKKTM